MRRQSLWFVVPLIVIGASLWLTSPTLAAAFTLSGQVTNQSSTGIVGATVDALTAGTTTVVASTTTGTNGSYSLGLDAGTYDIRVTPPTNSGLQVTTITNVVISAN